MPDPQASQTVLELAGVSKTFGGVEALRQVDFALSRGEIHGLIGENGAGKSTLMKIIAGVHAGYDGSMRIDGSEVHFRSARDARDAGIGMVHQELSILRDLSVAENVFLGRQPTGPFGLVDWRRMAREADEHLRGLGIAVDPRALMGSLPIGMQQLVELSRVLFSGARIIILDEPTSALSAPEVDRLFAVLRRLRESGRSIVFISHFLDDVLKIADTVTVLRNGEKIATAPATEVDKRWIIERMIGAGHRQLEESYTADIRLASPSQAPISLSADGLGYGRAFRGIDLQLHAGEVVGIYGFMGCGQIELARTLFGKIRPESGALTVEGRRLRLRNTADARRAGIAFVPESRRSMLFALEPIYKNVSISMLERLSRLLLKPARERQIARGHIERLRIRPPSAERLLGTLSGGNQQKVGLAKWLTYPPKVLVLSEPTRGMDVGAKDDVVKIVRGLREQGMAILVLSTEPETVLALADRILVMKKGEIVREFAGEAVSKDRLLAAA
ncbi:MAG TPA: sugar ABC transporter ATP-binding protein [Dongiaceae bacterium]|jgi:ribose transport system ATP-binding protein|nr:sugar ABC transporter ATP-binding protein [Dongiaceae bacterium]